MARSGRAESGKAAEDAAVEYLAQAGFDVLMRNVRLGRLEVDVVARKGPLIVVVEVRARGRGAWTSPLGSVDSAKRRRIRQAGDRLWQRHFKRDPSVERMRFDVVAVHLGDDPARIEHVEAAF